MHKILIFGNSGSGKSTLAKEKIRSFSCSHLDLDTIAWEEGRETPSRKPLADSGKLIETFLANNENWVIEGCYADLLNLVVPKSTEIIFLNPGIETCMANCRNRPWEPHKYSSPEAQDANLEMLLKWIEQYVHREDEFSLLAHRKLFDAYPGKKQEFTANLRLK